MKIEGGALFWPWLHYSHHAQEQGDSNSPQLQNSIHKRAEMSTTSTSVGSASVVDSDAVSTALNTHSTTVVADSTASNTATTSNDAPNKPQPVALSL